MMTFIAVVIGLALGLIACVTHMRVTYVRARLVVQHKVARAWLLLPVGLLAPVSAMAIGVWIAPLVAWFVPVGIYITRHATLKRVLEPTKSGVEA